MWVRVPPHAPNALEVHVEERALGKGEVVGSNPIRSSISWIRGRQGSNAPGFYPERCGGGTHRIYYINLMLTCSRCGRNFVPAKYIRPGSPPKFCSKECRYSAHADLLKKPKRCRKCSSEITIGVVCSACKKPSKHSSFEELRKDGSRKARMLKEQTHRHCEMSDCLQTTWKGQPIPLELDHIDGHPEHNDRSNLRLICPNCHAMLPTHRGRNIGRSGPTERSLRMRKYGSYR